MSIFQIFEIVQTVPNRAKHYIFLSVISHEITMSSSIINLKEGGQIRLLKTILFHNILQLFNTEK